MTRSGSRFLDEGYAQEIPSGTVNGINTTFTMAYTPDDATSVQVFIDGLKQAYAVDFTVSGTTITMTTAPAPGQTIDVSYHKRL